jgi:large subunit ribosomal protein L5
MPTKTEKKPIYKARLKTAYRDGLAGELKKELGLKNQHQVPRLVKIVVAAGLGRAKDDKKTLEAAENTLRKITGQQPLPTYAKKSIASFKLRQGSKIGYKVTLRDERMFEFADRLINIVLPRLRDFRGVSSRAFDKDGNFSIGFSDQSVFPELSFEETAAAHGLQVIFVISSADQGRSRLLLEKLGMPFEKPSTAASREETS